MHRKKRNIADTKENSLNKNKRLLGVSLNVGLLFKGVFALGEILFGVAMIFLTPDTMNRLIAWITIGELKEDPTDWLMNYLVVFGHSFTISFQHFAILYLLSHGVINLTVIVLLWKRKMGAYPLSILVLCGFIVYQMAGFASGHSIMLLALTIIDAIVIVLTILEYREMKRQVVDCSGNGL